MSWPKRAICAAPARVTASQRDIVHEAAHEENAATAGFEQVLGRERIGDHVRIEAFALIEHAHDQLDRRRFGRERELDGHELRGMLAVAVLDGVDDGFTHRDANPMHRILVEAGDLSEAIADHLDDVQHREVALDLQPDSAAPCQHAGSTRPLTAGQDTAEAMGIAGFTGTRE
jgi:hypothetical protein